MLLSALAHAFLGWPVLSAALADAGESPVLKIMGAEVFLVCLLGLALFSEVVSCLFDGVQETRPALSNGLDVHRCRGPASGEPADLLVGELFFQRV